MDDLHFRLARAGEGPRLRPLWQECFGDTQDFWEVYETFAFSPGQVELGFWEEILCSMMTLLPGTLWTKTGTAKKAACIYGLATLPRYQGQGAATVLLKRAVERLKKRRGGLSGCGAGHTGAVSFLCPGSGGKDRFLYPLCPERTAGFAQRFHIPPVYWGRGIC